MQFELLLESNGSMIYLVQCGNAAAFGRESTVWWINHFSLNRDGVGSILITRCSIWDGTKAVAKIHIK